VEGKALFAEERSDSGSNTLHSPPRAAFARRMLLVPLLLASVPCLASQPIYYPARGQSPQQQDRDVGQCQVWAQQTTGINPAALGSQPQAPSGPAVGGGERLAGAARGAILGEVFGGHGGEGAVVGAMVGGARARRNQQSAQQQADSVRAGQINTYTRAVGACMEGRGYTVR
jgi:hypothetical protein